MLLVWLKIPKFAQSLPQEKANFGIATLAAGSPAFGPTMVGENPLGAYRALAVVARGFVRMAAAQCVPATLSGGKL